MRITLGELLNQLKKLTPEQLNQAALVVANDQVVEITGIAVREEEDGSVDVCEIIEVGQVYLGAQDIEDSDHPGLNEFGDPL
jgi:hypothetical protein